MNLRNLLLRAAGAGALTLAATVALAQDDPADRVGRISYVEGEVSFEPPQADFWTDAEMNFPVASGESFWTGDGGRAELEIGAATVRLDNETELDVIDTRYGGMRLGLPQGSADIELFDSPRGGVTVSTPAGDVHLDGAGEYRVDVGAPGDDGGYAPVAVTVLRGGAQAPGPDGYTPVYDGEAATLYAGYAPQVGEAQDAAIDDFARERDAQARYDRRSDLPPGMTGAEDLGAYGQFQSDPTYGTVWFPNDVPPDWAPYRYGRWAYVAPWGYTWIDDAPWGFAPFHYGRWARFGDRWGWVPGQPQAEPVYAPALVTFIGGAGFGVSIGLGGGAALGWVPLAPDEVYVPPYQVSEGYLRHVNRPNVSAAQITNITVNRTVNTVTYRNAGAATVVSATAFSGGGRVQGHAVHVSAADLARAPVLATRPSAIAPPTPQARAAAPRAATGGTAGPVRAAPPPPARLQAVRAAVIAHPAGSAKPPVIAGAHIAAAPPPPAARALIAPAQKRNPAAQGRQPVPPPATPPATRPRPATPTPRAEPAAPAYGARPPRPDTAPQPETPVRPEPPAARENPSRPEAPAPQTAAVPRERPAPADQREPPPQARRAPPAEAAPSDRPPETPAQAKARQQDEAARRKAEDKGAPPRP